MVVERVVVGARVLLMVNLLPLLLLDLPGGFIHLFNDSHLVLHRPRILYSVQVSGRFQLGELLLP